MTETPATPDQADITTYEDAILVHFHSERKVNPYDSKDIEWISKPPVVLHRRVMGDSDCLAWIIEHINDIECMSVCDLITEGY